MTTIVNGTRPALLLRLRAALERFLASWKRRSAALDAAWIDQYFKRQRAARERALSRAHDRYELERLERAFDRGDGETWRVL